MLHLKPIGVEEAKRYVAKWHRHNPAPLRGLFAAAVADESGDIRGVAIVTHPTARAFMDGWTCEVNRVATDGASNACSMLYGACMRAARALGYRRIVTYTLAREPGVSLRAAGWVVDSELPARKWANQNRYRIDRDLLGATRVVEPRVRWVKRLTEVPKCQA